MSWIWMTKQAWSIVIFWGEVIFSDRSCVLWQRFLDQREKRGLNFFGNGGFETGRESTPIDRVGKIRNGLR